MLVPLNREAEDRLEAFARDIVERCHMASACPLGRSAKLADTACAVGRAGVPVVVCRTEEAEPRAISPESVTAAADLLNAYFLPMAERVFGDAVIPVAERRGMLLARHLRHNRLTEFNAREVRRQIGGMLRDSADMDAACKQLIEAGLIRARFTRAGGGKGRKSQDYEVHPAVSSTSTFSDKAAPNGSYPLCR